MSNTQGNSQHPARIVEKEPETTPKYICFPWIYCTCIKQRGTHPFVFSQLRLAASLQSLRIEEALDISL